MRKIPVILLLLICGTCFSMEIQWTRAKMIASGSDKWDGGADYDVEFLEAVEKYSTLKVNKKINYTTFEDLDKVTKFPIIFLMAEGDIEITDVEVKNMREYCLRGGFIYADDCVANGEGDFFFKSFKDLVEKKLFPGKKMEKLPDEHPIYHCMFDMLNGVPYMSGKNHGGYGIANEKGRLMIFLTSTDIHCGWSSKLIAAKPYKWTEEKKMQAVKMGINILIYALTH